MRSAPRPCTHPGCGDLVIGGGRCAKHSKQIQRESDARRGSARKRGYTGAWERARAAWLRSNPLCLCCAGIGEVVDHKRPHMGDRALFWDRSNWQTMCKRCHDIKTATKDGGFGLEISQVNAADDLLQLPSGGGGAIKSLQPKNAGPCGAQHAGGREFSEGGI